jgi:hypothetical protein
MSSLFWTDQTPIHLHIFAGILARAKGMAVKGGGALLLAFIAYNVALGVFAWCMFCFPLVLRAHRIHRVKMIVCPLATGALRTIGFWIGSVALAGGPHAHAHTDTETAHWGSLAAVVSELSMNIN